MKNVYSDKLVGQENFLIIGPSWVGDMVMAQSLFICLHRQYPNSRITVMAPKWTRPLLERMPQVENSIDSPFKHGALGLGRRWKLGRKLAQEDFTAAIILPNSMKSALVPFHAGIPRRIGWRGEWRRPLLTDCRPLVKEKFPLMVQRFAALAYPEAENPPQDIPPPTLQTNPETVDFSLMEFKLETSSKILAICPGAEFGPSKQWPAENYAALANVMLGRGWKLWIFGSANDAGIAASILSAIDPDKHANCTDLTGKTSLGQAIDLLSTSTAVVANDSGLMHIAAALNKPVVAIYGSTSPDFTPPLTDSVKLLSTDIGCRPCFKRECPYGHMRCLTELNPTRAIDAVAELTDRL